MRAPRAVPWSSARTSTAAAWLTGILLALLPATAGAQREVFLEGLAGLTGALAETGRQDGERLAAALDAMTVGLAEWDRAIRAFEARAASGTDADAPSAFRVRLSLAGMYVERGRLADALRELDTADRLVPRQAGLQMLRALVLEASGHPLDAGEAFRSAWQLDPADPVKAYHALRYRVPNDDGDAGRARTVLAGEYRRLARAHAAAAGSPFVRLGLLPDRASAAPVLPPSAYADAYALLARGDYENAIAAARSAAHAARTGPSDEAARLALARAHLDGGRPAEAERSLLDALDAFPRSALAHWWLGSLYDSLNRVGDARRELEIAAASPVLAGAAPLYAAIGRLARIEGDFPRARAAYERQVRLTPNDPVARRQLARIYLEHDRADDAFAELVAALLIDPRDAEAHAAIGQLHLDAGRDAEAVTALRRALDLDAALEEARYALGTALMRLGRAEEGRQQLEAFERARQQTLARQRTDMADRVRREGAALQAGGDGAR